MSLRRVLPFALLLAASVAPVHARSMPLASFPRLAAADEAAARGGGQAGKTVVKPPVSYSGPVDSGDFLIGLVAGRAGEDETAARAFRAALAVDPDDVALRRQAFIRSALAGDEEAVALARAYDARPGGKTVLSAFVLGNDAARRGAWAEAAKAFAASPDDALTRLVGPIQQAWCLQGQGRSADAIRLLTSSELHGSPVVPFYIAHAALIAGLSGDHAQEEILFRQAAAIMPGSDLLFTRAHAAALWHAGHQDQARALLRTLTLADPMLAVAGPDLQAAIGVSPIASPLDGLAHGYVLIAFMLRQQATHAHQPEAGSQIDDAAGLMLHMALSLDPKLAIARLMLSEVEQSAHHDQLALQTVSGVAATDPIARVARFREALFDQSTGRPAQARKVLQALVEEEPDLVLPSRMLGSLLLDQKDYPAAVTAYGRAIDNARKAHVLDWTLLFGRAAALERQGNWPAAEADLREARNMVPDEPLVLNFLGYGWVQRGLHKEEARALLDHALALDPDDSAIRDSLGWAMVEEGGADKGVRFLEQAAEQTPEDAEINYHLGMAYWRLGRQVEAVDEWNVALGLHPEPDDKARILKALTDSGAPVPKTD